MSKPAFSRGADALKDSSKRADFSKTEYFKIADGDSAILRFLTDYEDWITTLMHGMVPTKAKPEDFTGNWPGVMGAVCRKDHAFANMHTDCFICDFLTQTKGKNAGKPWPASPKGWALACLREEVKEKGKVVGYRDMKREVVKMKDGAPTDEKIIEQAVVVVNMSYKNFFQALAGYGSHFGTILDRDYLIKRNGKELDTDYSIIPIDPIVVTGKDGSPKRLDLRDPEFVDRYKTSLDLDVVITQRASDDYYGRFFDTRVSNAKSNGSPAVASGPDVPKQSNDVEPTKLAALAERVKGYGGVEPSVSAPVEASTPIPVEAVDPVDVSAVATAAGMKDYG